MIVEVVYRLTSHKKMSRTNLETIFEDFPSSTDLLNAYNLISGDKNFIESLRTFVHTVNQTMNLPERRYIYFVIQFHNWSFQKRSFIQVLKRLNWESSFKQSNMAWL